MLSLLRRSWLPAILLASLSSLSPTSAQVTTECNPMEKDKDCPDNAAFGTSFLFNFNSSPPLDTWEETADGKISYDPDKGAIFSLAKQGDSPTLRTKFYFFGGRSEIMMKCAPGTGIISSMMWLSDTLDEVDWEFFGTNATYAASNYFGKGAEDFTNGEYHPTGFDIYDDYHNYTTIWTKEKLEWWVDGRHVRTQLSADANSTRNFPQTPMRLSLGIWAGGDPRLPDGTREWAGGTTNFDEGPFEMYIKSVKISDASEDSKTFIYGDRSGMWDSIEVVGGNSTAREALSKESESKSSVSEKFNGLPLGARVAIYAGSAALGAVLILLGIFFFIRQRRRGAREAKLAASNAEQDRLELHALKIGGGGGPDKWTPDKGDYTLAEVHDDGTVREKAFADLPGRPDNSWPEDPAGSDAGGGGGGGGGGAGAGAYAVAAAAPLLGNGPRSPGPYSPGPYSPSHGQFPAPQSPGQAAFSPGLNASDLQRSASSPMGYMPPSQGPASPVYGNYDGPRSASAAPVQGQGYGSYDGPRSASAAPGQGQEGYSDQGPGGQGQGYGGGVYR